MNRVEQIKHLLQGGYSEFDVCKYLTCTPAEVQQARRVKVIPLAVPAKQEQRRCPKCKALMGEHVDECLLCKHREQHDG